MLVEREGQGQAVTGVTPEKRLGVVASPGEGQRIRRLESELSCNFGVATASIFSTGRMRALPTETRVLTTTPFHESRS